MCEYCKPGEKEIIYNDYWEHDFIRSQIRFYEGNNGVLYLGCHTMNETGKTYNTCKRVNFCPMCGHDYRTDDTIAADALIASLRKG